MADIQFSDEELLRQASGNQSAMFILGLAWAKQRDGSIDGWAEFIGEQFAEGWETCAARARSTWRASPA